MPDNWDDDDNTNDQNANGPKALRDHLKKIEDELKAERATREKLEVQVRQGAIRDVLSSQGYSPKIAAIVPKDVEATEEKLMAWLDEHAEIFPKVPAGTAPTTNTGAQGIEPQPVQDRMGAAVAAGLPVDQVNSLEAKLDAAKTAEEVAQVMADYRHIKFKS